jgi:hypothetical protein
VPPTSIQAEPTPLSIDLGRTALVIIDMQRDFLVQGRPRSARSESRPESATGLPAA